ncbi:MAG: hypothetical protein ACK4P3_04280 [Fimbriimonadaceae bacterium]
MRNILIIGAVLIFLALAAGIVTGKLPFASLIYPQSSTELSTNTLTESQREMLTNWPASEQEREALVLIIRDVEMPLLERLQQSTPENPDPFVRVWRFRNITPDLEQGRRNLDNFWMFDTMSLMNMLQEFVETGQGTKELRTQAYEMYEQLYEQMLVYMELRPKSFKAVIPTYGYQEVEIQAWEAENFVEPELLKPMIAISEELKQRGQKGGGGGGGVSEPSVKPESMNTTGSRAVPPPKD